jgi:hypothetical protein
LMVGIAGSTFPTGKPNRIVPPAVIPTMPINVGAWVLFMLESQVQRLVRFLK